MVTIYHNPRCSKSRRTLDLLREHDIEPHIVHYLDDPPDVQTLKKIASLLGFPVGHIIRMGEQVYKELGLAADSSEEELFKAVAEHPILLERPIVINGGKAVVGRPPENVLQIIM